MATLTGIKLTALLKERGMSQKELAEAACLTPASVSRYVNGERELFKIGQYQDRNANEKLAALPLLSNP